MSNRDLAIGVINNLSEEKLQAFLTLFADENTLAKIETDSIANDNSRKRYNDFSEIAKEILEDE